MDTEKQNRSNANRDPAVEGVAPKGCLYWLLNIASILLMMIPPFCFIFVFSIIRIVKDYERAVIYRMGRLIGAAGPGLFLVNPCLDEVHIVDQRTISFDIPPQEILTKDSVTMAIDAVVYYRITDPLASINNISNVHHSIRLLASTTLRNQLGVRSLSAILTEREQITFNMCKELDEATDPWGILVERVEIKDIKLPLNMQRAMAAEAEATRDAQAKIIAAKGEFDASKALKQAADIISQSKGALQLRYLQTLATVAAEKNSTILFPMPMELMPKGAS